MISIIISACIGVILGNIVFELVERRYENMACGKGKKKK